MDERNQVSEIPLSLPSEENGFSPDILRVMIVDDEALIRKLIRMRVDWASLHMEIVAEASSAGEALAMLDSVEPDIIFTDICMPTLDGIAFSRMVIERNPAIRIVIVTGHDEFEYAKSCIKIGVSDFLLKPLRAEELTKTAAALRNKILEERSQNSLIQSLRQHQDQTKPSVQEAALLCLMTGCGDIVPATRLLQSTGAFPSAGQSAFQVAIIELAPALQAEDALEEDTSLNQLTGKALAIVRKTFHQDVQVFVMRDGPRRIALVSGSSDKDLDTYAPVLLTQLLNGCHCHVSIGTGTMVRALDLLPESYQQACQALSSQIVLGRNRVIRFADAERIPPENNEDKTDRMERLSLYLRAGKPDLALSQLEEVFASLSPSDSRCLAILRRVALDVVLACGQARRARSGDAGSAKDEDSEVIEHTLGIDNLPDMTAYLGSLIEEVAGLYEKNHKSNSDQLVERVIAYIQNSLSDPALSLSGTAATFYVSPSHLSRLFRRETGRSFVEYVTRERMAQAFTFVTQSDMKSCEIGKRIGIDDPHYFSILFKKHVGMSVNACRKR